jgi:predicted adenylyl cyclase CyaB
MNEPALRRNLERKARLADLPAAHAALRALGAREEGIQRQSDVYFQVPHGRLKLRVIDDREAVLIWYQRPDCAAARLSHYRLVPIADAVGLRAALTGALGVRCEVHKCREVWHWHNVRIHLDEVEGLGTFVEFEAVLGRDDDEATAHERLRRLGVLLGLRSEDELAGSYADLLLRE